MAWDREKERKVAGGYRIGVNVFGLVFSIFWCIMAASMGAWFMLIFGIPFVGMMGFHLAMSIKMMNAEKNKTKEPWEGGQSYTSTYTPPVSQPTGQRGSFCPYCGGAVEETFEYCPKCGRKLS